MIALPYIPTPAAPPPNPPPHRGGGQAHAQQEPGGGASPASPQASHLKPQASPSPASTHPSSFSLHPSASPASPQDSGLKTQDSPLHPSDSALLEALVAAPSIESYAKSNNLCLTTLALWLQQPHITAAHEALLHLRALDQRTWQEQVTKEAIDTLRETMKASEDLVERRRCANTILRALTRSNRPARPSSRDAGSGPLARPRRPHQTETVGERAPSSTPSSASTSDHSVSSSLSLSVSDSSPPPYDYDAWAAEAEARQTALRTDPTCPEVLQTLDNKKPAPFPEDFATTPESCSDHAVARLSHIPDPTGHRLYLAIYDALDIDLRDTPGHWDPFKRALEASHFVTCREGWTRTDHPLERQPKANTATRRYTFTNQTTGETKSCTLALAPRRAKVDNPNHWWITHLITHNTS